MATYDYTGVVEKILPEQTFSSGFRKQIVVMTDGPEATTRWPNHIPFTFKQAHVDLVKQVKVGQQAKIRFAIDGREWNNPKTGAVQYFVDITALGIEVVQADGSSVEPLPTPADPEDLPASSDDSLDDMPF